MRTREEASRGSIGLWLRRYVCLFFDALWIDEGLYPPFESASMRVIFRSNLQDEYFFKFLDMINNHPQGFLFMKDLSDILILNHDLRNQFITKYYDIIISY